MILQYDQEGFNEGWLELIKMTLYTPYIHRLKEKWRENCFCLSS